MKKAIRTPVGSPRMSWWWTWVWLVSVLAAGCKTREPPKSPELVCEPIATFEILKPEQGAGEVPFSIEQLGPVVDMDALDILPIYVTFTEGNRAHTEWMSYGPVFTYADVVYSPAEGLARNPKNPKDVYPMKRFFDGKHERVRLGFRSTACREPDRYGGYQYCEHSKEELFLVADMLCRLR